MSLYDFANLRVPSIQLIEPIHHPEPSRSGIIGHVGLEHKRDVHCATFPRNREGDEQHYFRKYQGYAISESILNNLRDREISRVFIVERNGDHSVFEYDPARFFTGTQIAYCPGENSIVEGEKAVAAAKDEKFTDRQRVVPTELAVASWDRREVDIHR